MKRFFLLLIISLAWVNVFCEVQSTIPVVKLQYSALSSDTFSLGYFAFINDSDTLSMPMGVRHRGVSSRRFQKKSYAIKLYDENGQKKDTSLFGMRSDNYWILDAMAVDKARMRNRVAMDLWMDFSAKPYYQSLEPKLCNGYNGKFVEVYVNDAYEGIYCLMERIDRKQLKLKKVKDNTINGVLYKAVNWQGSFFGLLFPYDNESLTWMRYEYKYPDVEDSLINWTPLYDAMDFTNTATTEEFVSEAPARFDIPVFMDYYLFTALLSARDNCGRNLYLSYYNINENSKLLITPWDIDHSWGRTWTSEEEVPDTESTFDKNPFLRFKDEIPNYYSQLLARYAALRENFFSLDSLKQRFTDYFDLFARTHADERETERWNNIDNIALDFSYEEDYIHSWLEQRLVYTDSLFHYEDIGLEIKNNDSPTPFQKLLLDGRIYIRRGEKVYTLEGREVSFNSE